MPWLPNCLFPAGWVFFSLGLTLLWKETQTPCTDHESRPVPQDRPPSQRWRLSGTTWGWIDQRDPPVGPCNSVVHSTYPCFETKFKGWKKITLRYLTSIYLGQQWDQLIKLRLTKGPVSLGLTPHWGPKNLLHTNGLNGQGDKKESFRTPFKTKTCWWGPDGGRVELKV